MFTRSPSQKQIKEILEISTKDLSGRSMTRAMEGEKEDPMVYLVNYENSEGFAILAANTDIPDPIIAVTEKGNISSSFYLDDCCDKNFADFMKGMLMAYFDSPVEETSATRSSSSTLYNISPEFPNWWGQGAPFNNYCPIEDNLTCPVGCVPLAVAMSLCHYKRTSHWLSVYGNNHDCTLMQNYYYHSHDSLDFSSSLIDSVAHYAYDMALQLNTTFHNDGSSATLDEAAIYLHSISIYNAYRHLDFDLDYVIEMLPQHKPVAMNGFNNVVFAHGHCWIIDGIHQTYDSDGDISTMLHCNWGSYGLANGYYAPRTFSPRSGPVYKDYTYDRSDTYTLSHNYNCYYRTLTY